MADLNQLRKQQAAADATATASEAADAQAQSDAAAAQAAAAPPNDTPANVKAAVDAAANAVAASKQAATARDAATAAMNATNDEMLAQVRTQLDQQSKQLAETRNVNGMTIDTRFHWSSFVLGNAYKLVTNNGAVRVTGAEHKIVEGFVLNSVFGMKGEVCLTGKFNEIGPWERKWVMGSSQSFIAGIKRDVVGGAKWDEIKGPKVESHAGVKVVRGPSHTGKHPAEQWFVGKRMEKYARKYQVEDSAMVNVNQAQFDVKSYLKKVKELNREISTATKKIGKLDRKLGKYEGKMKTFNLKSSGVCSFGSDGVSKYVGGPAELELTGGSAKMHKGGSSVLVDASGVTIDGTTKIC